MESKYRQWYYITADRVRQGAGREIDTLNLKKPLIIVGLIAFFGFDEILLIVLLWKLGFPHLPAAVWLAIGAGLTFLNFLLALLIYKLMQTRPTTGPGGLVGQAGVVLAADGRRGKVLVRGEHWDAESQEELREGDDVVVVSLRGLVLVVRRSQTGTVSEKFAASIT
ncbi:MAG: NfeD family protein [Candidatus Eisenbacteria bacterium]